MKEMYNEPTKTNEAMKKTMKKFLSMAALALVGAVMMGCSSDDLANNQQPANKNNVVTLTTTVNLGGDGTRALTIDGNKGVKTFGEGDKIAVIYKGTDNKTKKVESVALTEGDITNEGKSATFTVTLEAPKASGDVRYIYPAAMAAETVAASTAVNADATINYAALASQDGTLDNLASKYDLAVFDGSLTSGATLPASSTLENKLAILAYTIKDNAATPNDLTGSITRVTVSDGPNTYGVTRTAADGPVYIAIRPTSDATISIMATTGTTTYTKSLASKTYAANNIYKAGLMMTEVPGAIPGMFSVSATKKVYFSKGNLRYASGTWSFFDNQYDYYTSYSANAWDKFGWSTSTTNYGMNTSDDNSDYSGNFVDWGSNSALQTALGTGWRTLTGGDEGDNGEWEYLFGTNSYYKRTTTSGLYFAKATVNDVPGVILLPDDWSTSYYTLSSANSKDAAFTVNQISSSDWSSKLESHGCVFLPAAGYREGSSVRFDGSYGDYWSSTAHGSDADYAHDVYFESDNVSPAYTYDRYYGFSVRLVRDVE